MAEPPLKGRGERPQGAREGTLGTAFMRGGRRVNMRKPIEKPER